MIPPPSGRIQKEDVFDAEYNFGPMTNVILLEKQEADV
jgi:hypothetical protein